MGTALVQSASNDFTRTALLLADHADSLCELNPATSSFLTFADKNLTDAGNKSLEAQKFIRDMLVNEVLPKAQKIVESEEGSHALRWNSTFDCPIESLWETIDNRSKRPSSDHDSVTPAKKSKCNNAEEK